MDSAALSKQLGTSVERGLTSSAVEEKLRRFGANELDKEEPPSLWERVKEQFEDLLVRLLLGAAVISFLITQFGGHEEHGVPAWVEPLVIFMILIANAAVGIWQDYDAEKALDALKELQSEHAYALRDGAWKDVLARDLVPGDIVRVSQGDKVPADCRLVELKTLTLRVDQSPLTGESVAVQKETKTVDRQEKIDIQSKHNTLFSGTLVANGSGVCVVTQTGMATELGKIQKMVKEAKESEEDTPLKKKLNEFGNLLARVVLIICVVIWVINYKNFSDPVFGGVVKGALYYFKIAIALAVAAIPEGLPAVITTCLALGTRRMAKHNAIVRKLPSVETLGCTTVICSDKTGTLTTNQMAAVEFVVFGNGATPSPHTVQGINYNPEGEVAGLNASEKLSANLRRLCAIMSVCNDATLVKKEHRVEIKGLPTEAALKVLVEKIGRYDRSFSGWTSIEAYNTHISKDFEKRATLEFSRDRKSMSVLALDRETKSNVLFIKGAPDYLIAKSKGIVLNDGSVISLDEASRKRLEKEVERLASKGLRTLAICEKRDIGDLSNYDGSANHPVRRQLEDTTKYAQFEGGANIVGIVAMRDPPRPEVIDSIKKCKDAGISVIMITGDIKETAVAIGQEIGIINSSESKERSFTGLEFFENQSEKVKVERVSRYIRHGGDGLIFARTEPRHKQDLVKLLKGQNHIVAMTGDGVNDAPALSEAHIGVAMGIAGTEVAKEASAMVLSDDNFATIVKAVEEGRSIYSNMKAFIRYMISSNIGEVVSIFLTSTLGVPDGLSSIQLLWVNLVTDGLPATALSFNPPERDIMNRPPRKHDEGIITPWIFFRYLVIGSYVGLTTVGIFIYWYCYYDWAGDGHTLVSFSQLSNWSECTHWDGFKVANFSPDYDFTANPCTYFTIGKEKASSMSLSVIVMIEMFNALNALSEEQSLFKVGLLGNPWLLLAIASSITLHCILLYTPFLGDIFGVVPLTLSDWKIVILFSAPVILIDEVLKFFARLRSNAEAREWEEKHK
eukprot:TRINITY_DN650_c0_g1_i1.p1 TRINITY_DN650_c0_g1~~TRINITY_DN650_c0_g1_i1.p1  ORF type:complete len:1018 (+),score=363.95 TRINITY_DN650_c0_g1_i1:151-3204(+)